MAEIIEKTGKSYNIFDKVNNVWNKISFWHKASDCEFNDGKTAQTKLGAINGISSSSTATDENIAASIGYVNQINTNLGNGEISFSVVDGEPYVKVGADPARPFKYKTKKYSRDYVAGYGSASITFDLKQDYPTTYDKLTIDNIIYGFEKLTYFQVNKFNLTISPSYDHTTGIVTLNITGSGSSGGYNSNGTVFIVVII